MHGPESIKRQAEMHAEAYATDLLGYRRAVIEFHNANPGYLGTASPAQLAPYILWGDTFSNTGLSNDMSANSFFVWRSGGISDGAARAVHKKLGGSLLVGYNRSGFLWTIKNSLTINTGIALPGVIPADAFVIVGE